MRSVVLTRSRRLKGFLSIGSPQFTVIVTATKWVSETAPEVAVELTVMLAVVGGGGGGVEFPPPHDTISMHHPIASASRLSRNAGC